MTAVLMLVLRIFLVVILFLFIFWAFRVVWLSLDRDKKTTRRIRGTLLKLETTQAESTIEKSFETQEVLIGRDPNADFVISDNTISSKHALFSFKQNHWWIEDLDSTNGTFLNSIPTEAPMIVTDGDELRCGKIIIKISLTN